MVLGLGVQRQLHLDGQVLTFGNQGLGMLLLSLSLCAFLLALRWNGDWLARIGPYSHAIFLFHLFFVDGSRQLLQRTGVYNPYLLFGVGLSLGLIGPIVVQRALLTHPWLAWAFLGQRRTQVPSTRSRANADAECW